MYRRPSGVYVVRLAVPQRLRQQVGRRELHVSTGLRDWPIAKIAAARILIELRQRLMTLDIESLAVRSPLLAGDGLLSITDAAKAIGLPESALLAELLNERADIYTLAANWPGWRVTDLRDVERDYDGSFVLNDVEQRGERGILTEQVRPLHSGRTLAALIAKGSASESHFRLPGAAAFFTDGEHIIPAAGWMASKRAVEGIRARLARSISPAHRKPAVAIPTPTPAPVIAHPTAKHAETPFSELVSTYRRFKKHGESQRKRMETESKLFIGLMKDPKLGQIDADLIHAYAEQLQQLPTDIYLARRRYGEELTFPELIDLARTHGLPRKTETTARSHVAHIGEILNFGVKQGMLHVNPAHGFKREFGVTKKAREQDHRDEFTPNELNRIFEQPWFKTGCGDFTANGHTHWRPFYYWLPLLGLLTGARLNELSQLYLDDIRKQEEGDVWYLDFNLEGEGKMEDASLKTVNAIRVVPIHDAILKAGFIAYVEALREAGHKRLFPELKHAPGKGYADGSGSWFNEKLLGKTLGIPRNGRKTFHSFRHTVATALDRIDAPQKICNQLLGHERGEGQGANRYRKDRSAAELKPYIDKLLFECLSHIAIFDTRKALGSLEIALRLKRSNSPRNTSRAK